MLKLKVANIVQDSTVDGPGFRVTIFTQGCLQRCLGCHNPLTQDLKGGIELTSLEVIEKCLNNPLARGITLSGGEPFLQSEALLEVIKGIKKVKPHYDFIAYSGYLYEDLLKKENCRQLLDELDILIDGPFVLEQKDLLLWFRGSSNQRVIDLKKTKELGCIIEYDFKKEY
ncbi:MAG: anaerobic ribonucleoside-triphosphate reductase activating protein [Bacillales bacterium]|jgi:anaerobic ribonucleoside-triphosphate reductase activating protein|nr:anaerobic ribonucleoside-triphosphate reductase activating protein [Bacillales bacterium]